MIKTYLVGGAVRDKLLGLPVKDKDWVVVGSTTQEMLALGFKQVGKDFPVFLHPKTNEEYALARTERKVKKGYSGFEFDANKTITLEQDLSRRDLTINAIAEDENGNIIDPFNGLEDIKNGLLKHTSPAFSEDPVRVLRVARFSARFKKYGFKITHSTHKLMKEMVKNGEVDSLVPERVWLEIHKTLQYQTPSYFFKTLQSCGALQKIMPIFTKKYQPHQNDFLILDNLKTNDTQIKWALLLSSFTVDEIKQLYQTINTPKKFKDLVLLTTTWKDIVKNWEQQTPETLYDFFNLTDAFRRLERFEQLLNVFELLNIKTNNIKNYQQQLFKIDIKKLNNIAVELPKKRLKIIKKLHAQY